MALTRQDWHAPTRHEWGRGTPARSTASSSDSPDRSAIALDAAHLGLRAAQRVATDGIGERRHLRNLCIAGAELLQHAA